ncbi:unnamed protein product [Ixodes hexagonus]
MTGEVRVIHTVTLGSPVEVSSTAASWGLARTSYLSSGATA